MVQTNVEQVSSENFGYLPWATLDPQTLAPPTVPPVRYFNELYAVYDDVCGGATGPSDPAFISTYANYAGSFASGALKRRFFYGISLDRSAWAGSDFGRWLDGGKMCAEGSPGFESHMPLRTAVNEGIYERLRGAAKAMLPVDFFGFEQGKERPVFYASIANIDYTSPGKRRTFAGTSGFAEVYPSESTGVYRNGSGDFLVMGTEEISWTPKDRMAHFGGRLVVGKDGWVVGSEDVFVVRKGTGAVHPLFEHAEEAVRFIDGLEGDSVPRRSRPLPVGEFLEAFGYRYVGNGSAAAASGYFKNIALDYEAASRKWFTMKGGAYGEVVVGEMLYNSSEQYFLAAAAYLANGEYTTAMSMIEQMRSQMLNAGIKYDDKMVKGLEGAIDRLMDRSYRSRSGPPKNGGVPVGGLMDSGEMISSAGPSAANVSGMSTIRTPNAVAGFLNSLRLYLSWQIPSAQARVF